MTTTATSSAHAPAQSTLPYGAHQGSYCGVVASSNRDDGFFSAESNYIDGLIYTGYRYQCVEYARRFLLLTTGCVFASCGRASEIYQMNCLKHVESGATYALVKHGNGQSHTPPAPGDVIIYPYHREHTPWGHVAIVSYVDVDMQRVAQLQEHAARTHTTTNDNNESDSDDGVEVGRVGLIEQNLVFTAFTSPDPDYLDGERCVARYVPLFYHCNKKAVATATKSTSDTDNNNNSDNGSNNSQCDVTVRGVWSMREVIASPPCEGWMSYPTAPRREAIHQPFHPLPEHIAVRSTPLNHPNHPAMLHYALRHALTPRGGDAVTASTATNATIAAIEGTMGNKERHTVYGAADVAAVASPRAQAALQLARAQQRQQQQQQQQAAPDEQHDGNSSSSHDDDDDDTASWHDMFSLENGAATAFTSAATATARIVRYVFALLLHRRLLRDSAFLTLPTNPLEAPLRHRPRALVPLFDTLAQLGREGNGDGDGDDTDDDILMPVLAAYFGLPVEWLHAMARSLRRGEEALCAAYAFAFNEAPLEERLAVFGRSDVNCAAAAAATSGTSSVTHQAAKKSMTPELALALEAVTVRRMPSAAAPHDEAWSLVAVDYNNPHVLVDIDGVGRATTWLRRVAEKLEHGRASAYFSSVFRCDFAAYLRQLEARHGARTGLTVVVPAAVAADACGAETEAAAAAAATMRALVTVLCDYCTRAAYTVRVVCEDELHYDVATARLLARARYNNNNDHNDSGSRRDADECVVNFVFAYAEWHDVLHRPDAHAALYAAAMDARADVVFAKPLWSYLCSGVVPRGDGAKTDKAAEQAGESNNNNNDDDGSGVNNSSYDDAALRTPAATQTSFSYESDAPSSTTTTATTADHVTVTRRFFDVARRLCELALPKQSSYTWDVDISEYKDSCRRVHLCAGLSRQPAEHMLGVSAMISAAKSAHMAYRVADEVTPSLRVCVRRRAGGRHDHADAQGVIGGGGEGGNVLRPAVLLTLWEKSDSDSDSDSDE